MTDGIERAIELRRAGYPRSYAYALAFETADEPALRYAQLYHARRTKPPVDVPLSTDDALVHAMVQLLDRHGGTWRGYTIDLILALLPYLPAGSDDTYRPPGLNEAQTTAKFGQTVRRLKSEMRRQGIERSAKRVGYGATRRTVTLRLIGNPTKAGHVLPSKKG